VDIAIVAVDAKQARHGTGIDAAAGTEGREGKESITLFRRLAYNAQTDESLLECRPLHGRSHQIRVHLAWLGFPIADDPMYCPDALAALQARDAALIAAERAGAECAAADARVEATPPVGSCATEAPNTVPDNASAAGISVAGAGEGACSSAPSSSSLSSAASQPRAAQPLEAAARAICAACRYGPRKEFNVMQRLCRGISLHSWSYCRRPARASSSRVASDGGGALIEATDSVRDEVATAGAPTLDTLGCYLVGPTVATAAHWCFTSPLPDWSLRFVQ
jgi:hypothetical protein